MSVSDALGKPGLVEIAAGQIRYRERGAGVPIVFVHGVGVNGDLWRKVVPLLADRFRCISPDLPWGSHSSPLREGVDLSLPGMARITADFIEALRLKDPVLVANDTGGAVAQSLVGTWPDSVGRLVLTSCDAFEKFPPTPQRYLLLCARSRLLMWLVAWTARFKLVQRLPTAYGFVTSKPMPPEIMRSFTNPVRQNTGVRRDLARLLRAADARYTFEAAEKLRRFDKPAVVLWAAGDKIFPIEHGRRLAELLPQGRFETIDGRTFLSEENPRELADRVRSFLTATA